MACLRERSGKLQEVFLRALMKVPLRKVCNDVAAF